MIISVSESVGKTNSDFNIKNFIDFDPAYYWRT